MYSFVLFTLFGDKLNNYPPQFSFSNLLQNSIFLIFFGKTGKCEGMNKDSRQKGADT